MTKHATVYWSVCLVAATALVGGRPLVAAPPQANAPLDERVAAVVTSEMLAQGVPSVSVAVMRDGKLVMVNRTTPANPPGTTYGYSNTGYFLLAVLAEKLYGKPFATALHDEIAAPLGLGLARCVDPQPGEAVGYRRMPDGKEADAMTIEQLLSPTSGLQRSVVVPDRGFENMPAETLLGMAVRENPASPGKKYEYSSAGYTLLEILVERLYGKRYGAVLRDEIAVPLRLTTLRKCAEPEPGEAPGYGLEPGGKPGAPLGVHHSQSLGAGGICATAGDLVRWTHALHTGRVMSDASYQAMTTPRGAAIAVNYGFGLSMRPARWGHKATGHGGQSRTGTNGR